MRKADPISTIWQMDGPTTILLSIPDKRTVQHSLIELTQPAVWLTGLHLLSTSDLVPEQHGLFRALLPMVKHGRRSPRAHIWERAQGGCCAMTQKLGLSEMYKWPQSKRSWSLRGFETQSGGSCQGPEPAINATLAPSPGYDSSTQTRPQREGNASPRKGS